MRSWWLVGVIAACGPSVAVQDVDSSGSASSGDTAGTTSTGTTVVSTASTATGVDDSSSDDTASGPRRCITTIAIDVDRSTYVGAARLRPDGPLRLLFRENADVLRDGYVVGADAIDGPWTTTQTVAGHAPSEVADIDGDGLHDVVMQAGSDATWWQPDADGVLAEVGPIVDASDTDALVQIPGDARAARAHATNGLELMLGGGDGSFAPGTVTPSPEMGYDLGPPVITHGEGLLEVGRAASSPDCIGFCDAGRWIFEVAADGSAVLLATSDPQDIVIALGDLDLDGELDLFTVRDSAVEMRRGPAFDERESLVPVTGARIGDFDGDGFVDVFANSGDLVQVYWNDGGTLLVDQPAYVQLDATPLNSEGRPVDLDDDGAAELVIGYGTDERQAIAHAVACE